MLYGRDLLDMSLRAELIVLSACETGLGQQVRGEGIVGMTWALFVAGAPASVVSQWSHRDDSSLKLMLAFYDGLSAPPRGGAAPPGKAKALQQAQLSLLRSAEYSHPYYWAAFVLVGDWR
jgi:CHAT domain-containing protein